MFGEVTTMNLRTHTPAALLAISTIFAGCTLQAEGDFDFGEGEGQTMPMDGGSDDGVDDEAETEDEPETEVPHAHGVIVLGESHAPGGGQPTPVVTASFAPDSETMPGNCSMQVQGCSVSTLPDCAAGCGLDEICVFDDGCTATCQAVCDLACEEGEECYFPVPGSPACRTSETFDAGALTFSGTTVPVTLFPPYEFIGEVTGALAVPEQELTVSASGATAAGIEAFERSFTATSPLVSSIDAITMEEAYGAGPMPVRWTAGEDSVRVSLTVSGIAGGYGVVTCDADDSGVFEVPRAAISGAVPGDEPSAIVVDLTRHSTTLHKDLDTTGSLVDRTVQPQAWIELVSSSSESTMIAGCGGLAFCGGECVNLDTDPSNCGGCNAVCGPSQTCSLGECIDDGTSGGGGVGGACCVSSASPGCSDATIEACVCAQDSYCCSSAWDGTCVSEVVSFGCGVC